MRLIPTGKGPIWVFAVVIILGDFGPEFGNLRAQAPGLGALAPSVDIARLREMLLDRGQPRLQNQAALALVQVQSGEA